MDSCPENSGANSRGILKNDLDGSSTPNERREHFVGQDNDRMVPKGSNKYVYITLILLLWLHYKIQNHERLQYKLPITAKQIPSNLHLV